MLASGSSTTSTYDPDGNLATTVDPLGNASGATAAQHTTTYSYDAAGNETGVTDPLNHAATWTYDADNNQASQTTARGFATTYSYDGLNRIASVTPPAVGGTATPATGYTYDKYGNLTNKTNGRGKSWTYRYNTKHQVVEILDPLGRSRAYGYNAEGDLAGYFGGRSHAPGADPGNFYVYPVHDQHHRLTGIVTPDNESSSYYDYDADGHMDSTSDDAIGTSTFGYDAAGELTAVTQNSGNFAYTYDPTGHVATRDYQYGSKLSYHYNIDGLADQLTEDDHQTTPTTTTFGYDADQALTNITYPASTGMAETRTYNAAEQIATIQTKAASASTPLSKFTYIRDADGNPTKITTTRGAANSNAAYTYDSWDRLASWCPGIASCTSATNRVDYGYDRASNLTTENRQGTVTSPGSITNTYDDADELVNRAKAIGGTTTNTASSYDYDGNLLTGGRTWNLLNQMTTSNTAGTGPTTYTYDALNNRRTATTGTGSNAQIRRVLWDINNPLPMSAVVFEPNYDTTTEVYAPDTTLLESHHPGRAYDADYYGHDDRGSITDAFKSSGAPTWSNAYDPWGGQTAHSALSSDAINGYFGYAGAYVEPSTGELALRARDYASMTQRFTSQDPTPPPLSSPRTSLYGYANNEPGVFTDPTGMCIVKFLCESVPELGIQAAAYGFTHTVGVCLGGVTANIEEGDAYGCVALAGGVPTSIGTIGAGFGTPGVSLSGGLLVSNATSPDQLTKYFGQASVSVGDEVVAGETIGYGKDSCGKVIITSLTTLGIGIDGPGAQATLGISYTGIHRFY